MERLRERLSARGPATLWGICCGLLLLTPDVCLADCNGNGRDDRSDIEAARSEDCNGNGVPDECELSVLPLVVRQTHASVAGIARVARAGDLDGDGDLDLVAGSQDTRRQARVSVLMNVVEDGAEEFLPLPPVEAGERLRALELADLDQDGALDVVVTDSTSVTVLRNEGSGTFDLRPGPVVPEGAEFAVVADLSGDGAPDLVTGSAGSPTLSLLLNGGTGTFELDASVPLTGAPGALSAADFDADGAMDIAVADKSGGSVHVLLRKDDGAFESAGCYDGVGTAPVLVAASDLDGDGSTDLAAGGAGGIGVLLNTGEGLFDGGTFFPMSSTPNALAAGDIEGDGDLDLTIGYTGLFRITLLRSDGRGDGFRAGVQSVNYGVTQRSSGLAGADFDGDGDLDPAVVFTHAVRILWNTVQTSLPLESREYPVGGPPHTIALGDVDGDGTADVVTGNNRRAGGISVLRNPGNGVFAERELYNVAGTPTSAQLSDLDGDGDLDLGALGGGLNLFRNDGDGNYESFLRPLPPRGATSLTVVDVTADGRPDLVIASGGASSVTIFEGDDALSFATRRDVAVGSRPFNAAAFDLDGDGDVDLATANTGSLDVSVLFNQGDGTFAEETRYETVAAPVWVAAEDLDSDGASDLAVANGASVAMFWNTGGGAFETPVTVSTTVRPHSLVTSDMENDGLLEVVTANPSVGSVSVLFQASARTFDPVVPYTVGPISRFAVAGDVDGDADADIVAANRGSNSITVLANQSVEADGLYRESICIEAEFVAFSAPGDKGREREVQFVLPVREDPGLLPPLFIDRNRFSHPIDFLVEAFPERFGELDDDGYGGLVARRASRAYFVGTLRRLQSPDGFRYGFSIVSDTEYDAREALRVDEVTRVYESLRKVFLLEPLGYRPRTSAALEVAESWEDPPFPVFQNGIEHDYEAYSAGTAYGRVRIVSAEEVEAASRRGEWTLHDIVVVDRAPRWLEGVVGGVITGTEQDAQGRVALRSARRGTPNAFVHDAPRVFAPHDGELVRLEVFANDHVVVPATQADAETFWLQERAVSADVPVPDASYRALDRLSTLDLSGADGVPPAARFGTAAVARSRLEQALVGTPGFSPRDGLVIPVGHALKFLRGNTVTVDGAAGTFEEHFARLLGSPDLRDDSEARRQALDGIRARIVDEGSVDPALLEELATRVEELFGSRTVLLRLRPSPTLQTTADWDGGVPGSEGTVCVMDPTLCAGADDSTRSLEEALKTIWSSLWTFDAYEERAYFQLRPGDVAMAVLVTEARREDEASGLISMAIPVGGDDRETVVQAQPGTERVVGLPPGVRSERTRLTLAGDDVEGIERERASSRLPPGGIVLWDELLRGLGPLLSGVEAAFSVGFGESSPAATLEVEFRVEPTQRVAFDRVRVVRSVELPVAAPTFELVVPPGTVTCGVFSDQHSGRDPRAELEAKSVVRWRGGTLSLPTASDTFEAELFTEVLFGGDQEVASPEQPGLFRVVRIPAGGERTVYRFNYEQTFRLTSGETFATRVFGLQFTGRRSLALDPPLRLDEEYLTEELSMEGVLEGSPLVTYSSCRYETLPRWEVEVEFGERSRVRLAERFRPTVNFLSTGPASLMQADVLLDGERRRVEDYWQLVYAAQRHNLEVRYWVVLEPPMPAEGIAEPVHFLEVAVAEPPVRPETRVHYLGAEFQVLGSAAARRFGKAEEPAGFFRRGDVDLDGRVQISDALRVLRFVFEKEAPPACLSAADVNDDGRIQLVDPITLLGVLFRGEAPLPEPVRCGVDPTADALRCPESSCAP